MLALMAVRRHSFSSVRLIIEGGSATRETQVLGAFLPKGVAKLGLGIHEDFFDCRAVRS
jgi:hypothetical protein